MKRDGNLLITSDNAHLYADLTSVGGYLSISADAQLPALASVGGKPYSAPGSNACQP